MHSSCVRFRWGPCICITILISARDSAHDLTLLWSLVQASAYSVVASLTLHKVLLTMLMEQQTVTNPAVSYQCFVCHDKTLDQQCMLAQAHPPMINHLTSYCHALILIRTQIKQKRDSNSDMSELQKLGGEWSGGTDRLKHCEKQEFKVSAFSLSLAVLHPLWLKLGMILVDWFNDPTADQNFLGLAVFRLE